MTTPTPPGALPRRIVVVGASGNIGTAVLRRVRDVTDVVVDGVCRRPPPAHAPYDRVRRWHAVDIARSDAERPLTEVFEGADVVVHLAWGFQPTRRPGYLAAVGPGGTERVVRAATAAGVPRVVHMSSVGAYAPRTDLEPVDESWPTTAVPTSLYSRHKAAAEAFLDRVDAGDGDTPDLVRLRPGFVLQPGAGAALGRYGLPPWLPRPVLGRLPVVPLPHGLVLPVVHADDVADAVVRAAGSDAVGAFNLVARPWLTAGDVARALGGRAVEVPPAVLRATVDLSWRARLQPIDVGWYDLALQVPMISTARAESVLGWRPTVDPVEAFRTTIEGIADGRGVDGRVLGPRRSLLDSLATAAVAGTASRRARV